MPEYHQFDRVQRSSPFDPEHRGGFHGPRDHHDERTVNPRYRQWVLFGETAYYVAAPEEQYSLPFPVDPLEVP